ncbi:protein-disulfide reductase DsbD family protein [Marinobacteraceae bacterium S3BR75-40.1]
MTQTTDQAHTRRTAGYRLFALLCLLLTCSVSFAAWPESQSSSRSLGDDFLPVDDAFPFSQSMEGDRLLLEWGVTEGYYLYRSRITITSPSPDVTVGEPVFDQEGKTKQDPYFGEVTVFTQPVSAEVPVTLPKGVKEAELKVTYQGCAEAGLCYPPQTKTVLFLPMERRGSAPPPDASSGSDPGPGSTDSGLETASGFTQFTGETALWKIATACYLLGIGLTFTPSGKERQLLLIQGEKDNAQLLNHLNRVERENQS